MESVRTVERVLHPAAREELHRAFEELTKRPGVKVYVDGGTRDVLLEWKLAEGLILVEDPIVPLVNHQLQGYALVPAYAQRLR